MMAVITVLWALVGYSLAFGPGNGFIGGLQMSSCTASALIPTRITRATIPAQTYMIYQLMFAIITPALITGAFAERMKFSAMACSRSSGRSSSTRPWRTWSGARADCSTPPSAASFLPRFCRRHRRPHHLRRFRAGLRALSREARGYPKNPSPPHSVVLSFIGACCCGSAGSASTPAAPSPPAASPPAPSSPPISPPPPPPRLERRRVDP